MLDIAHTHQEHALIWEPIIPLDSDEPTSCPQPFPIEALSKPIRNAIEEVVDFVQCPIPLAVSCALSAMSVVISPLVNVERLKSLTGPVNLFLITLADSGERKSTVDAYFFKYIKKFVKERNAGVSQLMKKYDAEHEVWKEQVSGIKQAIKLATKQGDCIEELSKKMNELMEAKPEAPRHTLIFHEDFTTEGLKKSLNQYPVAIIHSAEAGVVLGGYSTRKDDLLKLFATFNTAWDGKPFLVIRATSDSFETGEIRLTLGLMLQPEALQDFKQRTGDLSRGTGFLARVLLCHPESTQGKRPIKEAPNSWPSLDRFNERIGNLLSLFPDLNAGEPINPRLIRLSEEAKGVWIDYANAIESQLLTGGAYQDIRDVASKVADNAARIACLFHVFEYGTEGEIQATTMEQAIKVMGWYLNENHRILGQWNPRSPITDAESVQRYLVRYCQDHHVDCVSFRTLNSGVTPKSLRKAKKLRQILAALEQNHYVQQVGQYIFLHPGLLHPVAQRATP